MVCIKPAGFTCHAPKARVPSAAEAIVVEVGFDYFVLNWPTEVGLIVHIMHRGPSGQMISYKVPGADGTWTSPTVDLSERQVVVVRYEYIATPEVSIWKHLEVEPLNPGLHFLYPGNSFYLAML